MKKVSSRNVLSLLLALALCLGSTGCRDDGRRTAARSSAPAVSARSTPKPSEAPAESSVPETAAGPKVPDFGAFAGAELDHHTEYPEKGFTQSTYDTAVREDVVQAYIELLEDYDFRLRSDETVGRTRSVVLDYDGPLDGDFTAKSSLNDAEGWSVILSCLPEDGDWFSVYHMDALDYTDTGERCSQQAEASPPRVELEFDPDAPVVPDFGAFAGAELRAAVEDTNKKYTSMNYDYAVREDVMAAYITLLTEAYGFDLRSDGPYGEVRTVVLDYGGSAEGSFTTNAVFNNATDWSVLITCRAGDSDWIHVVCAAGLNYADTGDRYGGGGSSPKPTASPRPAATPTPTTTPRPTATPKPASTPRPTSTPKPTASPKPVSSTALVASSNKQVPDFGAFAGLTPSYEGDVTDATQHSYDFKSNEALVKEYIELLTNTYNFEISADETKTTKHYSSRNISFHYTGGAGGVGTFRQGGKNVALHIWYYKGTGGAGDSLNVTCADGLDYADTDHRTTQTVVPDGDSGSSSSSGGSSGRHESRDTSITIRCTECWGNKKIKCSTCDGDGYKIKIVDTPNYSGSGVKRGRVKIDCPDCVDGKIECPKCHGDGVISSRG